MWQEPLCCHFVLFCLVCNFPPTFASNEDLLSLNAIDDISRVKLSVQTHSTDDYINANYMPVSGDMSPGRHLFGWTLQGSCFCLWHWIWVAFHFLGLPFQERFYCHTRAFAEHFERFLAYGLGEKCICHCYVDQMCRTGKGRYLLFKSLN